MNNLIYTIPILSGVCSWLCSLVIVHFIFYPANKTKIAVFTIQGLFPSKKKAIIEKLLNECLAIVSLDDVASSFVLPTQIEKVIQFVDPHVDHFLRVKLSEKMPVISMFIGEKTIADLKQVFMEELLVLFPKVITQYFEEMQANNTIQNQISQKLNSNEFDEIYKNLPSLLSKQIKWVKWTFFIVGCIIGLIQLAFTLLILK